MSTRNPEETIPGTAPMHAAEAAIPSNRNRVFVAFGLVFFLMAVTLVVVAQNATRRNESTPILIHNGN